MDAELYRKIDQMDRPALEAMATQVKAARTQKGLSQRALSERTGIPQSHISKIENAGSDIRMSSMLMIAHALDLELTLIPRKLMNAVEGLRRSASPTNSESKAEASMPAYHLDEEDDHG